MIPTIIVDPDLQTRSQKINQILEGNKLKNPHPNLLYFSEEEKLGVAQAKQIIEHLGLKAYQEGPQTVVVLQAEELTPEAQNSLLKTLEEPPVNSLILLGVSSEDQLLPTILSRCNVLNLNFKIENLKLSDKDRGVVEKLLGASLEGRFVLIEKIDNKEELISSLVLYFRELLHKNPNKDILKINQILNESQEYLVRNVTPRAVLENLALNLPLK